MQSNIGATRPKWLPPHLGWGECVAAVAGLLFALFFVVLATAFAYPTEPGLSRAWITLPVLVAFGASWVLLRSVSRFVQDTNVGRVAFAVELGVIVLYVFGIAGAYALAYHLLGLIYTVNVESLRTLGIDWTQHLPAVATNVVDTFYFSVVTLTTVGFGDFRPTPAARGIATVEALNGVIVVGVVVSYLFKRLEHVRAPRDHQAAGQIRPVTPGDTGETRKALSDHTGAGEFATGTVQKPRHGRQRVPRGQR